MAHWNRMPPPEADYPHCSVLGVVSDGKGRIYLQIVCKSCPPDRATVRTVLYNRDFITNGGRKCCSCANKGKRLEHGMTGTRTHDLWLKMIQRVQHDEHYIAQGITIEDSSWYDFDAFYADMGEIPDDMESLDRIDNTRGYGKILMPDGSRALNCRWANRKMQNNNKSTNVVVDVGDGDMTLKQAAELRDVNYGSLRSRMKRFGESATEAIDALLAHQSSGPTLAEIARQHEISYSVLWRRVREDGVMIDQAVAELVAAKGTRTIAEIAREAGVDDRALRRHVAAGSRTLDEAISYLQAKQRARRTTEGS